MSSQTTTPAKPTQCHICLITFPSKTKERQHHKTSHSKPYSKPPSSATSTHVSSPQPLVPPSSSHPNPTLCALCGTSFPSKKEYRKHKKQAHKTHAPVSESSASHPLLPSPPLSPTHHHHGPSVLPTQQTTMDHYLLYYINDVKSALTRMENKCAFCICKKDGSEFVTHVTNHPNCPLYDEVSASWPTFRNSGIAYPVGTCYFCSLPQVHCVHGKRTAVCPYNRSIKAVLFMLLHYKTTQFEDCPFLPPQFREFDSLEDAFAAKIWLVQSDLSPKLFGPFPNYLVLFVWLAKRRDVI